jgi:hypothetical protein
LIECNNNFLFSVSSIIEKSKSKIVLSDFLIDFKYSFKALGSPLKIAIASKNVCRANAIGYSE